MKLNKAVPVFGNGWNAPIPIPTKVRTIIVILNSLNTLSFMLFFESFEHNSEISIIAISQTATSTNKEITTTYITNSLLPNSFFQS